ncbi:hypothetical protein [Micromonospora avicenniae]|uniref:hypothetical protein n=1 Tax=Micromonospora avicenniae TaxID=1198245 RepID=UPI0033219016
MVSVALDEHTITVYEADSPLTAVPRRSTTDLNRTKAKQQITLPHGPIAELFKAFGARTDITLEAFGWELVTTASGPDFCPLY